MYSFTPHSTFFSFLSHATGPLSLSFPTRRSSDLIAASHPAPDRPRQNTRPARDQRHVQIAGGSRSEEHTSELQSPCKLVCRLLLEKKKTLNQILLNYSITQLLPLQYRYWYSYHHI